MPAFQTPGALLLVDAAEFVTLGGIVAGCGPVTHDCQFCRGEQLKLPHAGNYLAEALRRANYGSFKNPNTRMARVGTERAELTSTICGICLYSKWSRCSAAATTSPIRRVLTVA